MSSIGSINFYFAHLHLVCALIVGSVGFSWLSIVSLSEHPPLAANI